MPKRIMRLITAPMTKPMKVPTRGDLACLRIAIYHPQNAPRIAKIKAGINNIKIDILLSFQIITVSGET